MLISRIAAEAHMLVEILIGSTLGIIAGLTPGIHSNTFAVLTVIYASRLENAWVLIVSSAIAYTIADIVPTTLLGVPDEETALATFPAHEMVLEGRAFEAISISAFSSFLSLLLSLPLFLSITAVAANYDVVKKLTPLVLIFISTFLIMSEKADALEGSLAVWRKRMYALLVFCASGLLGIVVFSNPYPAELNPAGSIFLPLLTGLFGVPVLMQTTGGRIPEQIAELRFPDVNSAAKGSLAGFAVSIFPGISSGIATAIASFGERRREGYIAAMSGANTSNALLCLYMLTASGKARSGAAEALKDLGYLPSYLEITFVSIVSAIIALTTTLVISFILISRIGKLRPSIFSFAVFILLILIVYYFTGVFGLAVLFTAASIGFAAPLLGVRRVNCMGCLILPILFHAF